MKFLSTLFLACFLVVGLNAQVTAYQHTNYGGKSQDFGVGFHPGYLAIGNDVISSFKVKPGYQVIAYEHDKGHGRALTLDKNTPDLIKLNFNDVISNLEVVKIPSVLRAGQTLEVGGKLYSDNGRYQMIMQDDGNLCVYTAEEGFQWCSMAHGFRGGKVTMQTDGNLVVYAPGNDAKWSSKTHPFHDPKFKNSALKPVRLKLENDGRLVLYNSSNQSVWSNK